MKESKQRKSRTKSNRFSFLVAQTQRLQTEKKAVRSFRSRPPAVLLLFHKSSLVEVCQLI
jgi:hypothetical protein